jgi:2-methylcitrate dehydratase PrpD
MLQHGELGLTAYAADRIGEPAVLALAERVTCVSTPARRVAFSGRLEVETGGGRRLEHAIDDARGTPARPLDDSALFNKFFDCANRTVTADAAEQLFASVMAIERTTTLGPMIRHVASGRRRSLGEQGHSRS